MKLEYDPEVDAAYMRFRSASIVSTEEIAPGVMLDLAEDGRPVGLELLDASAVLGGQPSSIEVELVSTRAPAAVGARSTSALPGSSDTDDESVIKQQRARRYEELLTDEERSNPPSVKTKKEKAAALDLELGAVAVRATELLKLISSIDQTGLPPASVAELSQLRKQIEQLRRSSRPHLRPRTQ